MSGISYLDMFAFFLGNSDVMNYFVVEPQFPQKILPQRIKITLTR